MLEWNEYTIDNVTFFKTSNSRKIIERMVLTLNGVSIKMKIRDYNIFYGNTTEK